MRGVSFAAALSLAIFPVFVSAGMYREGGPVKNLQDKVFRKSLKSERTAVVAFVAPWCGHCQKLTPEFTKAAQSLSPLIDFFAVDCDADENKRLCAEQDIKGFPTIKSFPRGSSGPNKVYQGERTASSIVTWANGEIPVRVTNLKTADAVSSWTKSHSTEPRALLLTAHSKVPVMWKVLAAQFDPKTPSTKATAAPDKEKIAFGAIKDESGDVASALSLPAATDPNAKSRIVFWKRGDASEPVVYEGKPKFEALAVALKELREASSGAKDEL